VLLIGIAGILVGAQVMAAAAQNRSESSSLYNAIFILASGVLTAMAAIAITDYTFPSRTHSSIFYIVTGGVYPAILVAAARGSRLRWPATLTALVYMAIIAAQTWILPLVPGTPLLGPIGHEVTRMVPLPFPILLVVPALAIDLVLRWRGEKNVWVTSLLIGICFVAAMAAAQWPFGALLVSEVGRSAWFGGAHDSYQVPAEYLVGPRRMWTDGPSVWPTIISMSTWAVLAATLSARLGMMRGSWLRRVVR
jgi:hypothetical protein